MYTEVKIARKSFLGNNSRKITKFKKKKMKLTSKQ